MKRKPLFYGLIIAVFLFLLANSINNAAQFTANTHRFDPYKQFKFRVKWDGKTVAGISKISGLHRNTEVVQMREGGDASAVRKLPGQTVYEPILLERGLTHDTEFEQWANKVWNYGSGLGSESSLKDFRKDIVIDLFNEAGQKVLSYKVYRCWPSKYSPFHELDANETAVAIESLVLEHEGWERDHDVVEPVEPSFDSP
jgi:phage tail-like protein